MVTARPAHALVLLLLLGAAPPASAQAPAVRCEGLPSLAEEVACLRKALKTSEAALSQARGRPGAEGARVDAIQPRAPAVATSSLPAATREALPSRLGQEQVAAARPTTQSRDQGERVSTTVTPVAVDHLGLFTVQLENGDVWRQVESPGTPLRLIEGRRYPVEIAASGFGGYRMRFPQIGRQIIVKRLR